LTIRIEVIDDATSHVELAVVTGSYHLAWEQDGVIKTAGSLGIEVLLRQAAPLLAKLVPSFGFGRKSGG